METKQFTEHPKVQSLVLDLKNEGIHKKQFSDVLDEKGNQYVELVGEGGGVLGVALIGYNYVLEQMGLRFFSLAGTSAGSINSLLLAGMGDVSQPKAEKLVKVLASKNLMDFVDGDDDVQDFVNAIVEKAKISKMLWKGWQVIDNIREDIGLSPGNNFLQWLTDILNDNQVFTTKDLEERFGVVPAGLKIRENVNRTIDGLKPRFAVIASDLTTGTKVEFPRMRLLYWKDVDKVNPALYVRASMSVPYFFEPMVIKDIPQGDQAQQNWIDMVGFNGKPPTESYFVDGGIMSNFPIDVFHNKAAVPRMPTFGVRLGFNRDSSNKISNAINLAGAMFNSIRYLHDYDFILRNPDYKHLVQSIDVGDHDWLNFGLEDDAKIDLFVRGAEAAAIFVRKFDWAKYKNIRQIVKNQENEFVAAKEKGEI
jgi:NTE family protein